MRTKCVLRFISPLNQDAHLFNNTTFTNFPLTQHCRKKKLDHRKMYSTNITACNAADRRRRRMDSPHDSVGTQMQMVRHNTSL